MLKPIYKEKQRNSTRAVKVWKFTMGYIKYKEIKRIIK